MTWVDQVPAPIWGLLIALITATVSIASAKLTFRAQRQKNEIDKDQNAGALALDLARQLRSELTEVRDELEAMRDHHREVDIWYDEHRSWDEAVRRELERHEPGATSRLPRLRPMPHLAPQR